MAFPQPPYHHHHQSKPPLRNMLNSDGAAFFNPLTFNDSHYPPPFQTRAAAADGEVELRLNDCQMKQRRLQELEFLDGSQISSADFMQTAGSVSTGLGLSLDDRRVASSSGDSQILGCLVDKEFEREIERQDAEMDRYVKFQSERMRQAILKKVHAGQLQALSNAEEKVFQKLRQRETEIESINKRSIELEERKKQLTVDVGALQQRAKCTDELIASLRYKLQQVVQSRESKEGCGDSEVDDTASCCRGGPFIDFQLLANKDDKVVKDYMICKVCRVNEVRMLLLPCRHLCLCKDCESKISFCPLCQSSKFIGMEVYL